MPAAATICSSSARVASARANICAITPLNAFICALLRLILSVKCSTAADITTLSNDTISDKEISL
jgi:hypothetical protein